jgi:hypothetical protein
MWAPASRITSDGLSPAQARWYVESPLISRHRAIVSAGWTLMIVLPSGRTHGTGELLGAPGTLFPRHFFC